MTHKSLTQNRFNHLVWPTKFSRALSPSLFPPPEPKMCQSKTKLILTLAKSRLYPWALDIMSAWNLRQTSRRRLLLLEQQSKASLKDNGTHLRLKWFCDFCNIFYFKVLLFLSIGSNKVKNWDLYFDSFISSYSNSFYPEGNPNLGLSLESVIR